MQLVKAGAQEAEQDYRKRGTRTTKGSRVTRNMYIQKEGFPVFNERGSLDRIGPLKNARKKL